MKNLTLLSMLLFTAAISFSFTDKNPAPASRMRKALAFPVAGKKASIGDKWGASRDGGRRRHKGIDIFAKKGTPVVAIADGYIATKARFPVGGKVLWLKPSGEPWKAYYAHLDKWLVSEGQYVRKGQVIGTVGKTGNAKSTPPHLHFGIAKNNGWVNPMPYIRHSSRVVPKASSKKKSYSKKSTAKKSASKKRSRRR